MFSSCWRQADIFFSQFCQQNVIEKAVFGSEIKTFDLRNEQKTALQSETLSEQLSNFPIDSRKDSQLIEQNNSNNNNKKIATTSYNHQKLFDSIEKSLKPCQSMIDQLKSILIKYCDKGIHNMELNNVVCMEEFDKNFIYLLHFNFVYSRSMIVEFLHNQNINFSLLARLQKSSPLDIMQAMKNITQKNQDELLLQNFEPYEITLKQTLDFYLKLGSLHDNFEIITSSLQLTNYDQNYLILLCFESQEIFQNLENKAKMELSEMKDNVSGIVCEKQLIEIITFTERCVEKLLDFAVTKFDYKKDNQRSQFSELQAFNQILFFDNHEQSILGNKTKGVDKLLELIDIGTCNAFNNKINKMILQLNQLKTRQVDLNTNQQKQKFKEQFEAQIINSEDNFNNFCLNTCLIMKVLHKRKSFHYTKVLSDHEFLMKKFKY